MDPLFAHPGHGNLYRTAPHERFENRSPEAEETGNLFSCYRCLHVLTVIMD